MLKNLSKNDAKFTKHGAQMEPKINPKSVQKSIQKSMPKMVAKKKPSETCLISEREARQNQKACHCLLQHVAACRCLPSYLTTCCCQSLSVAA